MSFFSSRILSLFACIFFPNLTLFCFCRATLKLFSCCAYFKEDKVQIISKLILVKTNVYYLSTHPSTHSSIYITTDLYILYRLLLYSQAELELITNLSLTTNLRSSCLSLPSVRFVVVCPCTVLPDSKLFITYPFFKLFLIKLFLTNLFQGLGKHVHVGSNSSPILRDHDWLTDWFEMRSLTETWGWSSDLSISASSGLRLQAHTILCGFWRSNSAPHAWEASTLPTKPSPKPQ